MPPRVVTKIQLDPGDLPTALRAQREYDLAAANADQLRLQAKALLETRYELLARAHGQSPPAGARYALDPAKGTLTVSWRQP